MIRRPPRSPLFPSPTLFRSLWILNDPFTGGTHLPDVTLVSRTALGFAVSRAHHADVGGMEPASLPADSRELYQEGLVLPPLPLDRKSTRLNSSHGYISYAVF